MTSTPFRMRMWYAASCLALAAILVGCGSGGGNHDDGGLPPLQSGDPAFGAAGQALVSDRDVAGSSAVNQLWVGFAGADGWEAFVSALRHARATNALPFVGGLVVADAGHPLGFYFDPATTTGAEVVAEGFDIPLGTIARNPAAAQAAGHIWYVAATVEQAIPAIE